MRHPAHAEPWVRALLPGALAAAIEWATFAPASAWLTGLRLRAHHADLVFVAKLRGCERLVVFVIEHKSGPDPELHDQALRYAVHVRHQLRRRGEDAPLVVTLVLCHGGAPVLAPADPDLAPDVAAAFAVHAPRVRLLVDDLSACTEAELRRPELTPLAQLLCLCLRTAREADPVELSAAIERWSDLLRAVAADAGPIDPPDALDAVGWYLVDTSDLTEEQVHMAISKHLDPPPGERMTTGQRIRLESRNLGRAEGKLEGKAEGRVEGRSEALAQTLLRQLGKRFGAPSPQLAARIATAPAADLERWLDRILDAATLEAVFAE